MNSTFTIKKILYSFFLVSVFFMSVLDAKAATIIPPLIKNITISPKVDNQPTVVTFKYNPDHYASGCVAVNGSGMTFLYKIDGGGGNYFRPLSWGSPDADGFYTFSFTVGPLSGGQHSLQFQLFFSAVTYGGLGVCLELTTYTPINFSIINTSLPATNGACPVPATHYACDAGTPASFTNNAGVYRWWCNGLNGGRDVPCMEFDSSLPVVNGACSVPPVHSNCSYGTFNAALGTSRMGNTYMWYCDGLNGGNNTFCTEFNASGKIMDGSCALTHYNCSSGAAVNFTRVGNTYTWSCNGANGGINSPLCTQTTTNDPVDGVCAPNHYGCSFSIFPTDQLEDANGYTWSCNGINGGSKAFCSEDKFASSPPAVDLKLDNQDGFIYAPVITNANTAHTLTWISNGAIGSCAASSTDTSWTGVGKPLNNATGDAVIVGGTVTYTLTCTNAFGTTADSVVVVVNPSNVLELCTASGIPLAVTTPANRFITIVRSLFVNTSESLKAFYDATPGDCAGTEVTSTWAEPAPSSAVSISGNGVTPQVITAGGTSGLNEPVTITRGADEIRISYSIVAPSCVKNCSNAINVCQGTTFDDANSCGTDNCSGTRNCNYNWIETAP